MEIRKYFELNDVENTCHNLRDVTKAVLTEKLGAVKHLTYIRKLKKRSQIIHLSFNVNEKQIKPKVSKTKTRKNKGKKSMR